MMEPVSSELKKEWWLQKCLFFLVIKFEMHTYLHLVIKQDFYFRVYQNSCIPSPLTFNGIPCDIATVDS